MSTEPKNHRVPVMMTASEVEAIDTWSFDNRVRGRSEAIRQLVAAALKADGAAGANLPRTENEPVSGSMNQGELPK